MAVAYKTGGCETSKNVVAPLKCYLTVFRCLSDVICTALNANGNLLEKKCEMQKQSVLYTCLLKKRCLRKLNPFVVHHEEVYHFEIKTVISTTKTVMNRRSQRSSTLNRFDALPNSN